MVNNWYVTREEVHEAMDFKDSAGHLKKIDSAISAASRMIDNLTSRRFYPETKTKYFDYPTNSVGYRLWFNSPEELIEATSVTSGGTTIDSSDYFLEPINFGPPFNRLELDLDTDAIFETSGTIQRQIVITGTWGYEYSFDSATTLDGSINASTSSIDVANSSAVGIGSLLGLDDELVEVTDKLMKDTGQNTSVLTKSTSDNSITGITGGSVFPGEIVLIDAERMRVIDVAGTTLVVERAVQGSTLAAHLVNADIYAPRTLTVSRGILGTTAASHTTGAAINRFVYPADVVELCLAEAMNILAQRTSQYGRTIGSGEFLREAKGAQLAQLRDAIKRHYGRYLTG